MCPEGFATSCDEFENHVCHILPDKVLYDLVWSCFQETVATAACTSSLGQVGSRSVHDRLPTPYASAREFQEVSLGFVEVELRSLQVFMSETEGELRIHPIQGIQAA